MTTVKPSQPLRPATTALTHADMMKHAQAIKTQIQENTGLVSQMTTEQSKDIEKRQAIKEKKEKEELKKLKQLASKCGIKKGETLEKSVGKLVKGILSEKFDSKSRGFAQMVGDISGFISDHEDLRGDFQQIVDNMHE